LFIGYTSGTTGVPKGYKRTHDSWISSFKASVDAFGINQEDHFVAPGGFAHSLSLFSLIQSLYLGATFHIVQIPTEKNSDVVQQAFKRCIVCCTDHDSIVTGGPKGSVAYKNVD
jgi:acyl-coenzyme A synthetase/AMP-(fatty) acid ligase